VDVNAPLSKRMVRRPANGGSRPSWFSDAFDLLCDEIILGLGEENKLQFMLRAIFAARPFERM